MEPDWVKIHSSPDLFEVQFLRSLLHDKGINAVVLDQKDSIYQSIGYVHLYVNRDDAMKAKNLISKQNLE